MFVAVYYLCPKTPTAIWMWFYLLDHVSRGFGGQDKGDISGDVPCVNFPGDLYQNTRCGFLAIHHYQRWVPKAIDAMANLAIMFIVDCVPNIDIPAVK